MFWRMIDSNGISSWFGLHVHFRVLALELFPNALDHNVALPEMQPTSNWKSLNLRPPGRQGRTLRAYRLDPLPADRSAVIPSFHA